MAGERLLLFPVRCTGCCACTVACVVTHEGAFGRAAARIRVVKRESMGLDYPNVGRPCVRPPCVEACAVEALRSLRPTDIPRHDHPSSATSVAVAWPV